MVSNCLFASNSIILKAYSMHKSGKEYGESKCIAQQSSLVFL